MNFHYTIDRYPARTESTGYCWDFLEFVAYRSHHLSGLVVILISYYEVIYDCRQAFMKALSK